MRLSVLRSGKDPLGLVEQKDLVKALVTLTEIDGEKIRKILLSNNWNYNEDVVMSDDFHEQIQSAKKELRYAQTHVTTLLNKTKSIKIYDIKTGKRDSSSVLEADEINFLEKLKKSLEKKREMFEKLFVVANVKCIEKNEQESSKPTDLNEINYFVKTERQDIAVRINKLYKYIKNFIKFISHPYSEKAIYELISDLIKLKTDISHQYDLNKVKTIHGDYPAITFPTKILFSKLSKPAKK